MLFQEKLKELRKKENISQYDLAEALHLSRSVIAKWETGLAIPNEDNLSRLCDYFNVVKEDLILDFESEKIITSKNKKISKFQKIIYLLSILLIVAVITIFIVYSIGLKKTKTLKSSNTTVANYALIINNKDTYNFKYEIIKPSNESEKEGYGYVIFNLPLNRGDTIQICENQNILSNTLIMWSTPIIPEPNGGFLVQKEGYYDLILTETYIENYRSSITLNSKRIASLYEKITLYYINNAKPPIDMIQVLKDDDEYSSLFLYSWYIENLTLKKDDRIYFFATLKNNLDVIQIKDFDNNNLFEEVYDQDLKLHYIYVKETHHFNYIMLGQSNYLMTLNYEYNNGM